MGSAPTVVFSENSCGGSGDPMWSSKEVIGVVAFGPSSWTRAAGLETVYRPLRPFAGEVRCFLAIRTTRIDAATPDAVRTTLASVEYATQASLISPRWTTAWSDDGARPNRFDAGDSLAILAIGLAGVGLYGVSGCGVAQRERVSACGSFPRRSSVSAGARPPGRVGASSGTSAVLGVTATTRLRDGD